VPLPNGMENWNEKKNENEYEVVSLVLVLQIVKYENVTWIVNANEKVRRHDCLSISHHGNSLTVLMMIGGGQLFFLKSQVNATFMICFFTRKLDNKSTRRS